MTEWIDTRTGISQCVVIVDVRKRTVFYLCSRFWILIVWEHLVWMLKFFDFVTVKKKIDTRPDLHSAVMNPQTTCYNIPLLLVYLFNTRWLYGRRLCVFVLILNHAVSKPIFFSKYSILHEVSLLFSSRNQLQIHTRASGSIKLSEQGNKNTKRGRSPKLEIRTNVRFIDDYIEAAIIREEVQPVKFGDCDSGNADTPNVL